MGGGGGGGGGVGQAEAAQILQPQASLESPGQQRPVGRLPRPQPTAKPCPSALPSSLVLSMPHSPSCGRGLREPAPGLSSPEFETCQHPRLTHFPSCFSLLAFGEVKSSGSERGAGFPWRCRVPGRLPCGLLAQEFQPAFLRVVRLPSRHATAHLGTCPLGGA